MINALLLFLPTTIIPSLFLYLIIAMFKINKMKKADFNTHLFVVISIIIILSIVNFALKLMFGNINTEHSGGILGLFPYSLFMIPAYIIAKTIDRKILINLLYLICFEIFIGVLEYMTGTVSFFKVSDSEFGLAGSDLLYNKRVFGLSLNSSTLALKCLLGLIIIYLIKPRYKNLAIAAMIIGFFITFNRTYLLSALPLIIFFYWDLLKQFQYKYLIIILGFVFVALLIYTNVDVLTEQLFRGATTNSMEVVSSGRDKVYPEFWSFFMQHIMTGNGSVKLWLELMPHKIYHAHNSFLMTFASNGLIISLFYLYLSFGFIKKHNILPVTCIIIASLTQYTIFWGISLIDIIFIMLLSYEFDKYVLVKS